MQVTKKIAEHPTEKDLEYYATINMWEKEEVEKLMKEYDYFMVNISAHTISS